MKSIAKALVEAQKNMGGAKKTAVNPHLKSKYADLESVMEACLPALNAAGIALVQPIGTDDQGRYYAETVLIHESGEELRCRVPLLVGKGDMQGLGSALTYARRYGLMAMAGIAPEDDDGNLATPRPGGSRSAMPPSRPTLEEYPADRFDSMLPKWKESVDEGKDPEEIIGFLSTRAVLSDDQKNQIRGLSNA